MKAPKLRFLFLLALLATSVTSAFAAQVGVRSLQYLAPERGEMLDVVLWYPTTDTGQEISFGENGLFYGAPAQFDARLPATPQPLVVISHGGGGNAAQYGWIANALVARGHVVAAPNHPGSTTGNSSAKEAVKLWLRPADISAVLDGLAADRSLSSAVDLQRVGVLGFSAGGYTALALAGAQVDVKALRSFCDEGSKGMSDCAFIKRGGVDLHRMDLDLAGRSNRDARVDAVVSVDPGVASTLTASSLAEISVPVSLINLGAPGEIPFAVDARAASLSISDVQYSTVADAIHFSFLPECKAAGPAILLEEGEIDPLCDDAGGRSRAEIHRQLAEQISAYFVDRLNR